MVKVIYGKKSFLKSSNLGIVLNEWQQLRITVQRWTIKLELGVEKSKDKKFEGLSPVFTVEDHDISRGFSGWSCSNQIYFDDISIKPLTCLAP